MHQWRQPPHVEKEEALCLYLEVDKALKNQIIASIPDICIGEIKHQITGYGNMRSLTHLWDNYDQITPSNLKEKMKQMQLG